MSRKWLPIICIAAVCAGNGYGQGEKDSPITLPDGRSGEKYQAAVLDYLSINGGIKPYRFELAGNGSLPPGLELDKNSGLISGIPTEAKLDVFSFSIKVTDAAGTAAAPEIFAMKVLPAPLTVVRKTPPLRVSRVDHSAIAPPEKSGPGPNAEAFSPAPEKGVQDAPSPPPNSTSSGNASGTSSLTASSSKSKLKPDAVIPGARAAGQSAKTRRDNWIDPVSVGEPDIRAVVGFHQAGASGASSHQNFFSDFYLDRHLWNPRWRLWGDVRIASTAQQISAPVSQFVAGFATQVGNLQVNQLAQTAEFQTGLEWVWKAWDVDWKQSGMDPHRARTFGFIAGGGATGPFNPVDTLQLFYVPTTTSSQYNLFKSRFPTVGSSPYVGFVSPDRDRFYRQYQAGVRISTYINSNSSTDTNSAAASRIAAPATYTFTLGQDEAVTGGRFRSLVGRIEVFYPLPITGQTSGLYKFLYLFGTASLRLTRANSQTPLILQPATGVNGYDPGVAIITAPSNRDNYRIGVGVDFVNLFKTIAFCMSKDTKTNCP